MSKRNLSSRLLIIVFILTVLVLSGVYFLNQTRTSSLLVVVTPFVAESSDVAVPTRLPSNSVILAEDLVIAPPPSATDYNPIRLEIASADIDVPVRAVALNSSGYVVTPSDSGGYWIASAQLDVMGNIVIVGHNREDPVPVFQNLPRVQLGDELNLTDQLAREYQFVVDDIKIIRVDGAPALESGQVVDLMNQQPENEKIVTLVSCYPTVECPDRIVVRAKYLDK
ncbi:MAG: sortase domain-bontaining protein [Candidatus Promineifilaceae bacterium]